jgi:hypothetical protein
VKDKLVPIIIIVYGLIFIFYKKIDIFILIISIIFILFILILVKYKYKIKFYINKIKINNNIFEFEYENQLFYGIIFKIMAKIKGNTDQEKVTKINITEELNKLINLLSKRETNNEILILTNIKKKPGSVLIIYGNNRESVLKDASEILNLVEVITPNIHIIPTKVTSLKFLPKPTTFGDVTYVAIKEMVYESPSLSFYPEVEFDIFLGNTNDENNLPVGIKINDIFRHISIFGSTGSGKTSTAKKIAYEISKKGINVIILDWHGEYKDLEGFQIYDINNPLKINPLDLINSDIEEITEILGDVLQLTDPQRFLLSIILYELNKYKEFDINLIIDFLKKIEEYSNWMRDVKYALIRKIYLLFNPTSKKIFDTSIKTNDFYNNILNKNLVIDLSFIRNIKLRVIYGLFIIRLIADIYTKNLFNNPLTIFIEEAHNFFKLENNFLNKLLAEIRKYNIGFVIISQSPSSLSADVIKNTNIKIIHSIKSDIDKRVIRDSLSLEERLVNSLDKLEVGEAILSAPNIKIPIIIRIKKS